MVEGEDVNGRANSMTTLKTAGSSLFIVNLANDSLRQRASQLMFQAEQAAALRQNDVLAGVGTQLCKSFAGTDLYGAGQFYEALAMNRHADGRVLAIAAFEQLTESPHHWIRLRANLALGALLCSLGQHSTAHRYYHKAASLCDSNWACATVQRDRAIIESAEGRHLQALTILESAYPRLNSLDYLTRCQYFNSVAVELNALGRNDEAQKIIAPVISSPLAPVYPEWAATAAEIEQSKRPISIAFSAQRSPVLQFRVDRKAQVGRIERVLWNEDFDGLKLKQYADAGERAIS